MPLQSTSEILMIRPATAASNPETLATNAFQSPITPENALFTIQEEFDRAVTQLRTPGITVNVIQDTKIPTTPDAIFPNNWFSTHENNTLVLYPMLTESRAAEAKPGPLELLRARYQNVIDLRNLPPLEGTGSLVLDRVNRQAFAGQSPRTTLETLARWAQTMDYGFTTFRTADQDGNPIYHTNVMMSIGTNWACVVTDAIANTDDRLELYEQLESRDLIELTMPQMLAFAGNMIELGGPENPVIALSATAQKSLTVDQTRALEKHATLLPVDISMIEGLGGGSIRCMIAELF